MDSLAGLCSCFWEGSSPIYPANEREGLKFDLCCSCQISQILIPTALYKEIEINVLTFIAMNRKIGSCTSCTCRSYVARRKYVRSMQTLNRVQKQTQTQTHEFLYQFKILFLPAEFY